MPTYEYHCEKCNKDFSRTARFQEYNREEVRCPQCDGKDVRRLVVSVSVKTSKKS